MLTKNQVYLERLKKIMCMKLLAHTLCWFTVRVQYMIVKLPLFSNQLKISRESG